MAMNGNRFDGTTETAKLQLHPFAARPSSDTSISTLVGTFSRGLSQDSSQDVLTAQRRGSAKGSFCHIGSQKSARTRWNTMRSFSTLSAQFFENSVYAEPMCRTTPLYFTRTCGCSRFNPCVWGMPLQAGLCPNLLTSETGVARYRLISPDFCKSRRSQGNFSAFSSSSFLSLHLSRSLLSQTFKTFADCFRKLVHFKCHSCKNHFLGGMQFLRFWSKFQSTNYPTRTSLTSFSDFRHNISWMFSEQNLRDSDESYIKDISTLRKSDEV